MKSLTKEQLVKINKKLQDDNTNLRAHIISMNNVLDQISKELKEHLEMLKEIEKEMYNK